MEKHGFIDKTVFLRGDSWRCFDENVENVINGVTNGVIERTGLSVLPKMTLFQLVWPKGWLKWHFLTLFDTVYDPLWYQTRMHALTRGKLTKLTDKNTDLLTLWMNGFSAVVLIPKGAWWTGHYRTVKTGKTDEKWLKNTFKITKITKMTKSDQSVTSHFHDFHEFHEFSWFFRKEQFSDPVVVGGYPGNG